MEKLFKKAISLIEKDNNLVNFSLDIQSILINLIRDYRYESIKEISDNLFVCSKPNKSLLFLRAICFLHEKKFKESEQTLSTAISLAKDSLDVEEVVVFEEFRSEVIELEKRKARDAALTDFLKQKWEPAPEFVRSDLTTNHQEFLKRKKAILNNTPSILLISMARAASSGITSQIAEFLGSARVDIHAQNSPLDENPVLGFLLDFVRGGAVSYTHCQASVENLNVFKSAKLKKLIVHLRDPRQCLVSNYLRMHAENDWAYYRTYYNDIPLEYDHLNMSEQIDWHIDNVYQNYWINWISEWVNVADDMSNNFDIKFVTYESFMKDPIDYYREIGQFFNYDWSTFSKNDLLVQTPDPQTEVLGRIDFWRQKLSKSQIKRVQDLTPENLLVKFKWQR
jgi:hypothetical protein